MDCVACSLCVFSPCILYLCGWVRVCGEKKCLIHALVLCAQSCLQCSTRVFFQESVLFMLCVSTPPKAVCLFVR